MANPRVCNIHGCDKPGRTAGMCVGHYQRVLRHGDPHHGGQLNRKAPKGSVPAHLAAHMFDDCPRWPFSLTAQGYAKMNRGGVTVIVSRVVCELVNGPPPTPEHEAAHNCGKGHLGCFGARCVEWKTRAENMADKERHGTVARGERHPYAKLNEAAVADIRRRAAAGERQADIAARYGIVQSAVSAIKCRRRWAHTEEKQCA